MGLVKPGDSISIKNPERNSLVKAGRLQLKTPDSITIVVPDGIDRKDLKVLDHLIEWGVLALNEVPQKQERQEEYDPLDMELLSEYKSLNSQQAIGFIERLSSKRQDRFIQYERGHKNRKTVLRVFE